MTALNTVKTFVQNWADAVWGLGGILTAPLSPNKTVVGATKTAAQQMYSAVFNGIAIVPSFMGIHLLLSGDSGKSTPRRLGEGFSVGVLGYLGWYVLRRWL